MSISFKGYNTSTLTFEAGENIAVGAPVVLDENGKADLVAEDDNFIGVCTAVKGSWASVQTDGYVEAEYSGDAPDLGYVILLAGDDGTIAAGGEDGVIYYKVLKVDTTNKIVGFIL